MSEPTETPAPAPSAAERLARPRRGFFDAPAEAVLNRLTVTLELTAGSKTLTVPAGDIKELDLSLHSWGFEGVIVWWFVCETATSEDEGFDELMKHDLVPFKLTVDRTFDDADAEASPLELKGLLQHKAVFERAFEDVTGSPVLQRRYRATFADRASVLWAQHFPTKVYADKSLKDVVEEHKPTSVTLAWDWTQATTVRPVIGLGLGAFRNGASFLDWLRWLLDGEGVNFQHEYGKDAYKIATTKVSFGDAVELSFEDVGELELELPEPNRHGTNVLNGSTKASPKSKVVESIDKEASIRRDHLIISDLAADLDERARVEVLRRKQGKPRITLRFGRYPTVLILPNTSFTLADDFASTLWVNGKTFRATEVQIRIYAEHDGPTDEWGEDSNTYFIAYRTTAEQADDPRPAVPDYTEPDYPFHVQATVVSEVGEEAQLTWQLNADKDTQLEYYKVALTVFDALKIIVPFEPLLSPGHFYFPAYKGERAVIAIYPFRAEIARFVDWRPGAKLAQTTQGNHLLLGKKDKDETSVQHLYADNKPKLAIKRTNAKDVQTITVSEGTIVLETKEVEE